MQPLGFVQGCSVVSWSFLGQGFSPLGGLSMGQRPSGYFEQYPCPHGIVSAEHRMYGLNYEKTWIEQTFHSALRNATTRLLEEAKALGAHGIVGVHDRSAHHPEMSSFELSLSGTAVRIPGAPVPDQPFTTFLAGAKLNKLVESGFTPVSIALSVASVSVFASCITEYQLRGSAQWGWGGVPSGEISQVARAHEAARELAREGVRRQLAGDLLHAAKMTATTNETSEGPQIEVSLRGNRVRRFGAFEEMEPPRPVVRLQDR